MDDDEDLESELLALTGEQNAPPQKPARRKPVPAAHLDKLVACSLRDIPSDEELSGDDDDPELLDELSKITEDEVPPKEEKPIPTQQTEESMQSLLVKRLEIYTLAEQNAKKSGKI